MVDRAIILAIAAAALLACGVRPARAAAPTFQDLMAPDAFPDPQRGMVVESARVRAGRLEVVTTGARFTLSKDGREILCRQRIGQDRPVAILRLGRPLKGCRLTHQGAGRAVATFTEPRVTLRVNGDSLLMLQAHEPLVVEVERKIIPAWHASHETNHLVVDEWGGFGLYCSEGKLDDRFDPYADTVARYELPADAVLWLGVCPPKPYDWERSLKENVVWHWSNTLGYPSDETLRSWKEHGSTVLLQSEVMLWKDWNLDFVPRLGPEEFARVRKAIHDLGMRFIVYTSPYYFLKDTALEPHALNSFEGFKGWPPGTPTGENMELFMAAITRVMREYRPDGLYFDGQYIENPAALYALARRTRALIGEEGILEWHSTSALGQRHCYLPQADAYVDFILRGEGRDAGYSDFDYLRFFVSGYNVSNSIGVLCNNGPTRVTPELAGDVLRANARFHTIASWTGTPEVMAALRDHYRAHLTPALRARVDAQAAGRQKEVATRLAGRKAEQAALAAGPAWGEPALRLTFEKVPAGERAVSSANQEPFRAEGGTLRVRASAHTHAFLRIPFRGMARGLVVKLRQGSDGGMSWGPAAALRLKNGAIVRLGTRSDGKLQADITSEGQLHGSTYDPTRWVWLRVRWLERYGVVERSDDGKSFTPVWSFEQGGTLHSEVTEVLVGKVPYSGAPIDHSDSGAVGECEIGEVAVY